MSTVTSPPEPTRSATDPPPKTSPRHDRGRSFSDTDFPGSPRSPDPAYLPRAASYSYFPPVKDSIFEEPSVVGLKGRITEDELNTSGEDQSYASSDTSSPDEEEEKKVEINRPRRPSAPAPPQRRNSRLSKIFPSTTKSSEKSEKSDTSTNAESDNAQPQKNAERPEPPSRSLSVLRRKSWASRSTSPNKAASKEEGKQKEEPSDGRNWSLSGAGRRKSMIGRSKDKEAKSPKSPKKEEKDGEGTPKRSRTLLKRPKKPTNVLIKGPGHGEVVATSPMTSPRPSPSGSRDPSPLPSPRIPDVPPLPTSFSSDRIHALSSSRPSNPNERPIVPRLTSRDRLDVPKPPSPRKKDELWNAFRTLDGDFHKFQSKSLALKTNVVRNSLLSFLRQYASHPSTDKLRAEDLDRRTNIFNKWWTGLLEMIAGRHNQSISGTDRPAILDAIVGIMERPEWRNASNILGPPTGATGKNGAPPNIRSPSSTSVASSSYSAILVEDVQHNVRNTFTQNLLSQMIFVVEKMSFRYAPASLVSFCGKTCAYAFFYCPGIADILVRLWAPSELLLRRTIEQCGIPRFKKLAPSAKSITEHFPSHIRSLAFESPARMVKYLRTNSTMPFATSNVNWFGPWQKRWGGNDSELFYVFVKHFYILLKDYVPETATNEEKVCAPGLVPVLAQLLANLDRTIHRHSEPFATEDALRSGPSSITFDEMLSDPDASAAPLPMSPTNATRLMAENRVILLLRDFLSERNSNIAPARTMFADSFSKILKACARHVEKYDHQACHTLCDFLEEAIPIMVRYEQISNPKQDILEWGFWLDCCKQMADTSDTRTEIRLYAFLYTTWTVICSNSERKLATCNDFLLEPNFFQSRFNHWCPMVRAYFMRLLCWRVARFDGEASANDESILERAQEGLRSVWSHYLYLRDAASTRQTILPSTAPCAPAPGRRLLIMRTDTPMSPGVTSFLSFDQLVRQKSKEDQGPKESESEESSSPEFDQERSPSAASNASSDYGMGSSSPVEESKTKRLSGFLRSFMTVPRLRASPNTSRDPSPNPKEKESTNSPEKSETKDSPTSDDKEKNNKAPGRLPLPSVPNWQSFCFRFSLEWQRPEERIRLPANMRLSPPRLPSPAMVFLQAQGHGQVPNTSTKPEGEVMRNSRYAGRSLAEWTMVVYECQNFFQRRRDEGVPSNKQVETPTLGVEIFKRPG